MDTQLEFSWAEPDDILEIQDFLSATYGQDSIQAFPGRCRWLYFDNPLGLHVSTCRSKKQLVAVCGHLPRKVYIGDKKILAGFGIDFMVAEKWRRRGIGRRFLEMRLERFALSLSLGQSGDMSALYRNFDAVDLGSLYLGIHRRSPSVTGGLKGIARNFLVWGKGMRGTRPPADWTGEPRRAAEAATLSPDPEHFAWRYGSEPYDDYKFLSVQADRAGAVVVTRKKGTFELIVDIPRTQADLATVLACAAASGTQKETRILFGGNRWSEACDRAGFWVRPYGARIIAMTTDPWLREQLKPGVFEMTAGYADADLLRFPG